MIEFTFNKEGLIPAIVQDYKSNEVLMLAYMNKESLEISLETKKATYYSRSRKSLWVKGETSGHTQYIKEIKYDCDQDALLLKVEQIGKACHTNNRSCFYRSLTEEKSIYNQNILESLEDLLQDRKEKPQEGSYTSYLFDKGVDKILKKVAEETGEVIIAAKNNNDELIYEISDLFYHVLVLMVEQKVTLADIFQELSTRRK